MGTQQKKFLTKEDLRGRGWTHRQIREQEVDGKVPTGGKGRPRFGYDPAKIIAAERTRRTVSA